MAFENLKSSSCCDFCDRRAVLVLQEKGKSLRIENRGGYELCRIRVDDCLIVQGERCDYIVLQVPNDAIHMVELKGRHLRDAVSQIDVTLEYLRENGDLSEASSVYGYVILSKTPTPNIESKIERDLKRKLKALNGDLQVRTNLLLLPID